MRVAVLALVLAASPAWAQSKRYPPEPVDKDLEQEQSSRLWDSALVPQKSDYDRLVADGRSRTDEHNADRTQEAIATLGDAIQLMPKAAPAYLARGEAILALHPGAGDARWTTCADDLAHAEAYLPETVTDRAQLRRELGLCQARAGRLGDAERTLSAAAATGPVTAELWLRLGEVRIAMGKLDEAIAALDASIEASNDQGATFAHWLLAAAYDRKRQPGDAQAQVEAASRYDSNFNLLEFPAYPMLGAGEQDYLRGLANGTSRPEWALVYFRRFLRLSPDSPWKKRAEDHVKELAALDLPGVITKETGSATLDLPAARSAIKRQLPALRACLKNTPEAVYQVAITKVGARGEVARDRPVYQPPAPKTSVYQSAPFDTPAVERAVAQKCLEQAAAQIAMPVPTEHDTWYTASFYVISP